MVTRPPDTELPGDNDAPGIRQFKQEGKKVMTYESNAATNAGLIEVQIEYRAVAELILDSRNPRQHSQRQVNQLADSIREFGFVMPVVADGKGQVVIGHGRVLAAKKLRMPRIPVVEIRHLSPAQLKALRIADNRLAQNAHWDERLLGESLLELKELDRDFDLSITGFSLPEIDLAIQKLSEPVVEDIDDASSETGVQVCHSAMSGTSGAITSIAAMQRPTLPLRD